MVGYRTSNELRLYTKIHHMYGELATKCQGRLQEGPEIHTMLGPLEDDRSAMVSKEES